MEEFCMQKKLNNSQKKNGLIVLANYCALKLMVDSANSTCTWLHHQPKLPEEAKKYRKF